MAERIDVKMKGFREMLEQLKGMPDTVNKRIMVNAVRAGANLIRDAAKKNVPVETGQLKRTIKVKLQSLKRADKDLVRFHVGPQRPGSYYAHLVEFGFVHASGTHVPGQPFLRPAVDETKDKVVEVMADKVRAGINREIKKQARNPK